MARYLAKGLGEKGYVTVSGLARGVDTAAHIGALETGTVAVMAGGVDVLYPTENAKLGDDITDQAPAFQNNRWAYHPEPAISPPATDLFLVCVAA